MVVPGSPGARAGVRAAPVVLSGETKNRGSERRPRPRDRSSAAPHLRARKPQTPSSALRGRPGMDIMEPRRLEAWREFSRRLKVLAFIGGRVCGIGRGCASVRHERCPCRWRGLGERAGARIGPKRGPSGSGGGETQLPAEPGRERSADCPLRGFDDTRRRRSAPGSWPRPCAPDPRAHPRHG
jgi:hypothetical protein